MDERYSTHDGKYSSVRATALVMGWQRAALNSNSFPIHEAPSYFPFLQG